MFFQRIINGSIKSKPTHPTPPDICWAFENFSVGHLQHFVKKVTKAWQMPGEGGVGK